jgi:hypothetical protein
MLYLLSAALSQLRFIREEYYAKNPHARPVMSGDSDAIERLTAKLESCKAAQEKMKAVNKIIRKKPFDREALNQLMGCELKAAKLLVPDCFGGTGFAPYSLTNNNAEIKRLEGRIKVLTNKKEQGTQEVEINGVKVVQNSDDMRLQLFFDGKPNEEIRKVLKKNAFKWAPSKGAWQRQLTNNALFNFKHYVRPELEKMEA